MKFILMCAYKRKNLWNLIKFTRIRKVAVAGGGNSLGASVFIIIVLLANSKIAKQRSKRWGGVAVVLARVDGGKGGEGGEGAGRRMKERGKSRRSDCFRMWRRAQRSSRV
jgi:hypothetical protein